MNILLTGGAGYIGSNVAINLLDAGYEVTIIDDLSTGHEELIPKKANFIKTNINNVNILDTILTKNKFDVRLNIFVDKQSKNKNIKDKVKENKSRKQNMFSFFKICCINFNSSFSSTH